MSQSKRDPLFAAMDEFQRALFAEPAGRDLLWADAVHTALGGLAEAVQVDLQTAEREPKLVGDVNPDFQNAPVVERHAETIRVQLIELGENIHQLRAEIRGEREHGFVNTTYLRLLGEKIRSSVEKVRQVDDAFLVMAFNTNLGAGE